MFSILKSIIRIIGIRISGLIMKFDIWWKNKFLKKYYQTHYDSVTNSILNEMDIEDNPLKYPILLLHGMFGFGKDNHAGFFYFNNILIHHDIFQDHR